MPVTRVVEWVVLGVYLSAFLFFLAQSRLPGVLPEGLRLRLVNEELLRARFFQTYRELLEKNPDDPDANWVMGVYYAEMSDCQNAVPLLKRALAGGRESPEIYDLLAHCYLALGNRDQADWFAEQLAEKFPDYLMQSKSADIRK